MARVGFGGIAVGAACLLLAATVLSAQTRGSLPGSSDPGSTPPPAGSSRSNSTWPSNGNGQGSSDNSAPRPPSDQPAPIYLSGKVVLEDGTPSPDPVGIERVCNGLASPEGYTDSKGRFSIQLGQSTRAFSDASAGESNNPRGFGSSSGAALGPNRAGGIRERDLADCDLRASLGGYRSDTVSLAGRRAMDRADVGTLILHPYARAEGDTVSFTNLAAPKDAAKALQRGRDAAGKEKWNEARKQFEKAVQIHPRFASAWFELGRTLETLHDESGALDAYRQAIDSDARFIPPYVQRAAIELKHGDWVGLIETSDRIVGLDPVNFPNAYIYRAIAQYSLRDLEAAEKSARQALDLDTARRFPIADKVLGVILAQRGDLSGAAAHLRAYLQVAPNAAGAPLARVQLARIERLVRSTSTLPGTP